MLIVNVKFQKSWIAIKIDLRSSFEGFKYTAHVKLSWSGAIPTENQYMQPTCQFNLKTSFVYLSGAETIYEEDTFEFPMPNVDEDIKAKFLDVFSFNSILPIFRQSMPDKICDFIAESTRLGPHGPVLVINVEARHMKIAEEYSFSDDGLDQDEYEEDEDLVPASIAAIESLEILKYDDSNESDCRVCLDEFELETEVTKMPCGHIFHTQCIVQWLEIANYCPICRFKLPKKEDEEDD